MHVPFCELVARMCATWLFHATRVTSAACLTGVGFSGVGGAGTNTLGASGRSSDHTCTPMSAPPVAMRCELSRCGLNCSPLTEPACFVTLATRQVGWLATSFAGSQKCTTPSAMPPAIRPIGSASLLLCIALHPSEQKRPGVFTTPAGLAGAPPCGFVKSTRWT